jgi:cytochrome-b5 reductase
MRRVGVRVPAAGLAAGIASASWLTYQQAALDAAPPAAGLDPTKFVPLTLTKVTPLSHNTAIYRFAYKDAEAASGMTVASCLLTKAPIGSTKPDGSRANVMRPYTPISRPDVKGYLELAVKTYPEGKMSQHMAKMKIGDTLDFKGPIVKLPYKANEYKEIGMVAGGTGIAPMLQVADEILENPSDTTKIKLIFANVSEEDILLKKQIDAKAAANPGKLSVYYVVDKAPSRMFFQSAWTGGVGYVTEAMLKEQMPPPGAESKVYVCGPPPMYKAICGPKGTKEDPKAQGELGGLLKALGYTSEQVFKF